jgi:hypothetical protein
VFQVVPVVEALQPLLLVLLLSVLVVTLVEVFVNLQQCVELSV